MIAASAASPRNAETAAAINNINTRGFKKRRRKSKTAEWCLEGAGSLGPNCLSRASASCEVNPLAARLQRPESRSERSSRHLSLRTELLIQAGHEPINALLDGMTHFHNHRVHIARFDFQSLIRIASPHGGVRSQINQLGR